MARSTTPKKSRAAVKDETVKTAPRNTAKQRYEQLVPVRQPFLDRARDASVLTIPSLMPPDGTNSNTQLYTPFQSVGADGVNNIAAKLMLSLFPPGNPFFRMAMDDFVLAQLKAKTGDQFDDARAEFEEVLGQIERAVMNRMEVKGNRTVLFESLKHDVVCGNFLLQVLKGGKLKMFPLDRFVVKRDQEGNVLEIIAKEVLSRMTLPPEVEAIVAVHEIEYPQDKDSEQRDRVELFTHVKRYDSTWTVYQEVCGKIIPSTQGTYPLDNSPWNAVRWSTISGEDYGRGLIEEYIGDLNSLEALSQSIVEFSAAASKILFMVNESGNTDRRAVARAASGDFVEGDAKDITTLQLEKGQDFTVANTVADRIEKRLERAFLLLSGVQRDAERVTAEEIRTIVAELEAKLGGVYSVLAQELQLPLAKRIILEMQKEKALPHLPDNSVQPQIVTGLDGLGRTSDLQKLQTAVQDISQTFGPEATAEYINVGGYAKRVFTAVGLSSNGVVRSEEEVQQTRQQQQQSEAAQKLGPAAIKAAADMKKQQATQPPQSTEQ